MDIAASPFILDGADDHAGDTDSTADAALAALRAAMGANGADADNSEDDDDAIDPVLNQALEGYGAAQALRGAATETMPDDMVPDALGSSAEESAGSTEKTNAISLLNHLQQANTALMNSMNLSTVLEGLLASVKTLTENQQKQGDIIRALMAAQAGENQTTASVEALERVTDGWVLQSAYDTLQAKYNDLQAAINDKKPVDGRKRRGKAAHAAAAAAAALAQTPTSSVGAMEVEDVGEEKSGRKKRSVRLEHIIHQHLNRLIGLEYTVSGFEMPGSPYLLPPCPPDEVPGPDTSMNGIQEYRPDYTKSNEDAEIRVLLDQVVEEVWTRWSRGDHQGEEGVDRDKIVLNVNTYWNRLMKRWQEQQARQRGETHRDEISRRKQNRYRRQQSLVARRVAAFDASPLNACRQRALFRTLLTIDFAAATNERPEMDDVTSSYPSTAQTPGRYSSAEWYAYRQYQLGARAKEGHESVDIHWLSPAARSALLILDGYTNYTSEVSKRKGRPKAPFPTFHLPRSKWDTSKLPVLKPKDAMGLPVEGAQGVVLFEWHVDERTKRENPDWAQGLYETPPMPGAEAGMASGNGEGKDAVEGVSDAALPTLEEVLRDPQYTEIIQYRRREEGLLDVNELTDSEVANLCAAADLGAGAAGYGPSGQVQVGQTAQSRTASYIDDTMMDDQFGESASSTPGPVIGGGAVVGDMFAPPPEAEGEGDVDYYNVSHAQAVAAALVNQQRRQQQQQQQVQAQTQTPSLAIRPTMGGSKSDQGPTSASFVSAASLSSSSPAPATPATHAPVAASAPTAASALTQAQASTPASPSNLSTRGPGTSIRARKQSKRSMSAVPVGAATPVPKRPRQGYDAGSGVAATEGLTNGTVHTSSIGTLAGLSDVQRPGSGSQVESLGRGERDAVSHFGAQGQQVYGVQATAAPRQQQQQQQQQQPPKHAGVGVGVGIGVGVGLGMGMGRSLSGSHLGSSSSGM